MRVFIIFLLCAVFWMANALECIDGGGPDGPEKKIQTCATDTDKCGSIKYASGFYVKGCIEAKRQSGCETHEGYEHCYICETDKCNEGDKPTEE